MASSNADSRPTGHPEHEDNDDTPELIFEFENDKPTTLESKDKPTTSEADTQPTTSESNSQPTTPESSAQPTTSKPNKQPTISESNKHPTASESNTQPTSPESRNQPISYSNGKPITSGSKKPGKYYPPIYDPQYITRQYHQHGDRERGAQDR